MSFSRNDSSTAFLSHWLTDQDRWRPSRRRAPRRGRAGRARSRPRRAPRPWSMGLMPSRFSNASSMVLASSACDMGFLGGCAARFVEGRAGDVKADGLGATAPCASISFVCRGSACLDEQSSWLLVAARCRAGAGATSDRRRDADDVLGTGSLSGLGHPVIGLGHLAAVIAVGCLAATQPKGELLAAGYVIASMVGAAAHIGEATVPNADVFVALSVVDARPDRVPEERRCGAILSLALFAAAGLVNGYALGETIAAARAHADPRLFHRARSRSRAPSRSR